MVSTRAEDYIYLENELDFKLKLLSIVIFSFRFKVPKQTFVGLIPIGNL